MTEKRNAPKKLTLNKETLRLLDGRDPFAVQGGGLQGVINPDLVYKQTNGCPPPTKGECPL